MTSDTLFPIYDVMITLFGSILVSVLALAVVIVIMALIGRWSATLLLFWMLLYVMVFGIAYFGGAVAALLFIASGAYLIISIIIWLYGVIR